jgi:hypothetical protein
MRIDSRLQHSVERLELICQKATNKRNFHLATTFGCLDSRNWHKAFEVLIKIFSNRRRAAKPLRVKKWLKSLTAGEMCVPLMVNAQTCKRKLPCHGGAD